jgi:hypothetical protein
MSGWAPLLRSVICTTATNIYQLSTLLAALDANFPTRLSGIIIQLDVAATGNLYIGNSAVSPTNCGANLIPGGSFTFMPDDNSFIMTTDIYLRSSVSGVQVNINALPKGM